MEKWREIWRLALAPQFNDLGLEALRGALLRDDPALIQGATTSPPALLATSKWPVEAACAISYCGWKAKNLQTVQQVQAYFAKAIYRANQQLPAKLCSAWFMEWFDNTPRQEMRRQLLAEVNRELARRELATVELGGEA